MPSSRSSAQAAFVSLPFFSPSPLYLGFAVLSRIRAVTSSLSFPSRCFRHLNGTRTRGRGEKGPRDLRGERALSAKGINSIAKEEKRSEYTSRESTRKFNPFGKSPSVCRDEGSTAGRDRRRRDARTSPIVLSRRFDAASYALREIA